MCVGGMTVVGAAVGRFGGLYGLLAGAVVGVAYGLVTCRKLSPVIERKLFSRTERLDDDEILAILRVLAQDGGVRSKADGMYVLSQVRHAATSHGLDRSRLPNACMPLRAATSQIVATRA